MNPNIVIVGYGPVGRATAEILSAAGRPVRVAQRSRPKDLPANIAFTATDVLDASAVRAAAEGAGQIVVAIGFPYEGKTWRENWPRAMQNILAAAEATGARVVFVDNLYMYGPQTAPLVETMPLTDFGVKPKVRSEITRMWQGAAAAGKVRFAALRGPDFYGPGTGNSHLGDLAFGALAKGQTATFAVSPDQPHEFAYVPDFGRAAVTLLDAPDDCFGQAWHVPSAPTRTMREIFAIGAATLGVKAKARSLPRWSLAPMGLFVPALREFREMQFQWDRPYRVDATRFTKRFWSNVTPFEVGARETALAFKAATKLAA